MKTSIAEVGFDQRLTVAQMLAQQVDAESQRANAATRQLEDEAKARNNAMLFRRVVAPLLLCELRRKKPWYLKKADPKHLRMLGQIGDDDVMDDIQVVLETIGVTVTDEEAYELADTLWAEKLADWDAGGGCGFFSPIDNSERA